MTEMDIQRSLGRIEAKQDEVLRRLEAKDEADVQLGNRVRSLELWRAWLAGIGFFAATLAGVALRIALK